MTPALGARYQSSWGIPSTFEQMAKISLNYINFFELTKLRKAIPLLVYQFIIKRIQLGHSP